MSNFSFSPTYGVSFVPTLHREPAPGFEPASQPLPAPFVAVITGASRGIGRATAEAFAKAGATGLVLTARKVEAPLEDTKRLCLEAAAAAAGKGELKVSLVAVPSGDEEATARLATVVRAEHGGRLDLLVNNAGLVCTDAAAWDPFEGVPADQLRVPMETNYVGRFLTMKHLMPLLLPPPPPSGEEEGAAKTGGKSAAAAAGTVVNITSICSHFTGFGALGFNVSALASNRLTEAAAERFADRGLRCYSVHPGEVLTTPPPGLLDALGAGTADFAKDRPDLCASMLLWLARHRPDWLNGRYVSAGWDVGELERRREDIVSGDKLKFKMVV